VNFYRPDVRITFAGQNVSSAKLIFVILGVAKNPVPDRRAHHIICGTRYREFNRSAAALAVPAPKRATARPSLHSKTAETGVCKDFGGYSSLNVSVKRKIPGYLDQPENCGKRS
jgi:hypothetical protein